MTAVVERQDLVTARASGTRAPLIRAALERLGDTDVYRAAHLLDPVMLGRLSRATGLPKPALTRGAQVARLLHDRFSARGDAWVLEVAGELASGVNNRICDALGDDYRDPSCAQLAAAVDLVVAELGGALVGFALATAADLQYQAAPHCRVLLASDPRLNPEPPAPDSVEDRAAEQGEVREERDRGEVRLARIARKRARREFRRSERRQRPVYRRKQRVVASIEAAPECDRGLLVPDTDAPEPGVEQRRHVRSVMYGATAAYDDELIGAVIWANIGFLGRHHGSKWRPCVVIATDGPRHLIVRPCYSEGGMQTRRWKSEEIHDRSAAGLNRRSWVATEEHKVKRRRKHRISGRLSAADWNAL